VTGATGSGGPQGATGPEPSGALLKTNNLSDVANTGTSRANLKDSTLAPAIAVSTANIASLEGTPEVDGYKLAEEDTVLLTGQTEAKNNGPWVVPVGAGAWTRPADYATGMEVRARLIMVVKGTVYANSVWMLSTRTLITVGTTASTWVRSNKTRHRTGHAWVTRGTEPWAIETIQGPPVRPATAETQYIAGVDWTKVTSGTSPKVSFKIQVNGADVGLGTTASPLLMEAADGNSMLTTPVELKAGDDITLVILAISTAPLGGRIGLHIDHVA
jgi:hypothetical protein